MTGSDIFLTLNICTPFSNVSFDDSEQTNDSWVHLKGTCNDRSEIS